MDKYRSKLFGHLAYKKSTKYIDNMYTVLKHTYNIRVYQYMYTLYFVLKYTYKIYISIHNMYTNNVFFVSASAILTN